MTQFSTVPEYSVVEKQEKTSRQSDLSRTLSLTLLDQLVVRSRQSTEVCLMLVDISERTLDLLLELRQSVRAME